MLWNQSLPSKTQMPIGGNGLHMPMWPTLHLSLGAPLVLLSTLVSPWFMLSCWMVPSSWLLVMNLLCTLSKAHLGYWHLDRASLRCWISLLKNSSPVQTVSPLWVRVPVTLYLSARLWWLSHCKYWSVWVGFLYTEIERELSASGLTKVSRNGMAPFSWLPSTVNFIAGSILFIWSRNNYLGLLLDDKVSSTNLYQCLGGLR